MIKSKSKCLKPAPESNVSCLQMLFMEQAKTGLTLRLKDSGGNDIAAYFIGSGFLLTERLFQRLRSAIVG